MRAHPQSSPFIYADAMAGPSSPTSLTTPLLSADQSTSSSSPMASPPTSRTLSSWRDRAVAMLRGRATVRGPQTAGDDALVPLLAASSLVEEMVDSPIDSPASNSEGTQSGERIVRDWFDHASSTPPLAEPIAFMRSGSADRLDTERAIVRPDTEQARSMTRFLAEADGPHPFLNILRASLRTRHHSHDASRYLDDALLGGWINDYIAMLSRPVYDNLSAEEVTALEDSANQHFKRLATRLLYLDTPSLPVVSDADFVEFVEGHALDHGLHAVRQTLAEFCRARR